jgi:membrane protease YdiL (CAAX protease family)
MLHAIYLTVNIVMGVACIACIALWIRAAIAHFRVPASSSLQLLAQPPQREPSVPQQHDVANPYSAPALAAEQDDAADAIIKLHLDQHPPFWSFADAVLMYGLTILLSSLLLTVALASGWISKPAVGSGSSLAVHAPMSIIAISSLSGLLAAVITLAWVSRFDRRPLFHLGLYPTRSGIMQGLKGAVMLLPPVLLISSVANHYVPYSHPILDVLANVSNFADFLFLFLATAIITPIVEELMFRVLMQGGLQGLAERMRAGESDAVIRNWHPTAHWPMVVTSLVFAMLHFGQGAAPIPLFFLSLGLGYLYRQTGNITAPLVVHVILNALTLISQAVKPSL